jgi:hypothetical protein
MKKILFILFCFILICKYSFSQNLIPNPGFDEELNCPINQGELNQNYISNWHSPSIGSTDYFSKCNDTTGNNYVHIPSNVFTYQNTFSNNYIGLILYWYPPSITNYREYAQVKLDSCLKPSKYYRITTYLNKSNFMYYSSILQICLSKDSINNSTGTTTIIDTGIGNIVLNSPIIYDTMNWIEYSWVFNTGNKDSISYVTLGNFLRDEHTPLDSFLLITAPFPAGRHAYLLIDSVSLIPWHGVGVEEINILENINIYPNPVNDYLYIYFDNSKKLFYSLYDISGKLIIDKSILAQSIDVSVLDKGIYILEIKDEEGNSIRKKVIKE